MGARYSEVLSDETSLVLQLQALLPVAIPRSATRCGGGFGRMWQTVADFIGLEPVTIKAFLAFGMLLNNVAALDVAELDEAWHTR